MEGEPEQQNVLTLESRTVADFGGLCGYKDTTIRERQSAPREKRQSAIQDITDTRLLSQNLGLALLSETQLTSSVTKGASLSPTV